MSKSSSDRGFEDVSIWFKRIEPELEFSCAEFNEVAMIQSAFFDLGNTVEDDNIIGL